MIQKMLRGPRLHLLFVILALLASCAPSRYVRPLSRGQVAVSGSFGGALFTNFGAPLPLPFTTVAGGYGLTESTTGFAALHTTSLFAGVFQTEVGLVQGLVAPNAYGRPGISVAPVANIAVSMLDGSFALWPQIDANAFWEYGVRRHFFYAGLSSWFELRETRAHETQQTQKIFPGVQIGNTLSWDSWDFTAEVKFSNLLADDRPTVVRYVGAGDFGRFGLHFGIMKRF